MATERFKITPASYVFLFNDKNEVLLSLRQNSGYRDGQYQVPAGHAEEHESFAQCAVREAKEEANVEIKIEDLKLAHVLHRLEGDKEEKDENVRQRLDVFFITRNWAGEINNNEPEKCVHLKWFPLDNLPDNIFPYIKFVLEECEKGIMFSETGFREY
ncbi:MAG TPA: NUDIX domain-containing protein [Patescibacteria group bacterium]|nr:NUDIX domain-containing protein [Patescibacteria group bacterium]